MDSFKDEIRHYIKEYFKSTDLPKISLETPPDPRLGDLAYACFDIAKLRKSSPKDIAKGFAEDFTRIPYISKVLANGPYVNFFLDPKALTDTVLNKILESKERYGKAKPREEKILIEYSSPNTNKSQHLGHVRNNLLGMSLSNLLEFLGHKVRKVCLMNDKGIGVSQAIYSYLNWHNGEKPDKKPDHFVADLYVEFAKKVEEDPELADMAGEINRRFEEEEPVVLGAWKRLTKWVYDGYEQTYGRLGCKFDKVYYESSMYKAGKEIVYEGLKKGVFFKRDGAIYAHIKGLPDKVLIKSDGTSVYITQDIYLAKLKWTDFKPDKSIYIVGSEQELHFRQLFSILDSLGYSWASGCYHLSYGMISLPGGKMKSREGTTVDADDIIEEMVMLASSEIRKRHELSKGETERRAEAIGLAALKFYILKYDPAKGFTFNPKESISFEGETGPYIQYTHARICSILKKHGRFRHPKEFSPLTEFEEIQLLKRLHSYPDTLADAAKAYKPSILCRYLLSLSSQFNEFYHKYPVLGSEQEASRIALCLCVMHTIRSGLKILGIESPQEM